MEKISLENKISYHRPAIKKNMKWTSEAKYNFSSFLHVNLLEDLLVLFYLQPIYW